MTQTNQTSKDLLYWLNLCIDSGRENSLGNIPLVNFDFDLHGGDAKISKEILIENLTNYLSENSDKIISKVSIFCFSSNLESDN